jgi:NTE family protein
MLELRLRAIPLFRDLPYDSLKSIAARLKRERHPKGAVIFRQGDAGDAMYLVESGQVQVVAEDTQQPLAYLGPDSFVGEIALLLGQPRSATLKVVIDAELWALRKADLDELLAEYPSIALHLTREIGQRLVTTSHQMMPPRKNHLTAVWGGQSYSLALALMEHTQGRIGILGLVGSPLPRSVAIPRARSGVALDIPVLLEVEGLTAESLAEELSHQVEEFDHVLLILPAQPSAMARKALNLSDRAVAFGPPPEWIQQAMPADRLLASDGSPESVRRIARRLTGHTVGLALSSGGSKTVAHIGVMRVLRQAEIPIDMIAGASGGALFGALIAAGWSDGKLVEFANKLRDFNTYRNWDVNLPPRSGLIKGRRARDLIEGWLEGRHFADLETRLYIVAADVATGQEVVFDSGSVADAVRASLSIPGVADPWHYSERFLVDGALVNPLPASVLRAHGADIVIASSVVRTADDPSRPRLEQMPHFLQIIFNIIGSMETELIKAQFPLVDVLIHPHAFADHSLDFSHADTLVALGEEAAREQLDACKKLLTTARVPSQQQ